MKTGIGSPLPRVDGALKVTGRARYAAEHPADDLLYGFVVSSSIARGRIVSIDSAAARKVAGVVEVITHENLPGVAARKRNGKGSSGRSRPPFLPLHDGSIYFSGQPVALVVAETFEAARHAAALVVVEYEPEDHNTDLRNALGEDPVPAAFMS